MPAIESGRWTAIKASLTVILRHSMSCTWKSECLPALPPHFTHIKQPQSTDPESRCAVEIFWLFNKLFHVGQLSFVGGGN